MRTPTLSVLCIGLCSTFQAVAQSSTPLTHYQTCVLEAVEQGDNSTSISHIKKQCKNEADTQLSHADNQSDDKADAVIFSTKVEGAGKRLGTKERLNGLISSRINKERARQFDPFVITPHRLNYILPVYFTDSLNTEAYDFNEDWQENMTSLESKFQLSLKVPLTRSTTFIENDGFYFGMTLEAWWQVYSENISKPFRETNYRPEFFYLAPLPWHPFDGNTGFVVGIEHQSNGRSQELSRSWNRIYVNLLYEHGNFAMSFKPWWRINENPKESPFAARGDDNPDINEFLGYYEAELAYKWHDLEFHSLFRSNFASHKGAVQLGFTFPLVGTLRGYAQYFSGYGESLIDYNHAQQRLGIGVALNSFF
ncbi:phospholipase A [Flocculibacter collagenilyticus]|uniref:phospholipase A n=1 Tax=Flocculibacter collagenilyticus TaxID=2744479 RepID=UPI0018F481FF|nr:phospholipase A [Flocculibacter collagenilyticus]